MKLDENARELVRTFAAPSALAVATTFGLVAALVGDGLLEVGAWLSLGTPVAVVVLALLRQRS